MTEAQREIVSAAHWLIFDHISQLYRTDDAKARELDRALAHLAVRLSVTMPSARKLLEANQEDG